MEQILKMLTIWPIVYLFNTLKYINNGCNPIKSFTKSTSLRSSAHNRLLILWLQQYVIVIKINYSQSWKSRSYRRNCIDVRRWDEKFPYISYSAIQHHTHPALKFHIDLNGSCQKHMLFNVQCTTRLNSKLFIYFDDPSHARQNMYNHSLLQFYDYDTYYLFCKSAPKCL